MPVGGYIDRERPDFEPGPGTKTKVGLTGLCQAYCDGTLASSTLAGCYQGRKRGASYSVGNAAAAVERRDQGWPAGPLACSAGAVVPRCFFSVPLP